MGTYRVFKKQTPLIILSVVLSLFLLIVLFRQVSLSEFTETMSALFLPALLAYMAVSLAASFSSSSA